MTAPRSKRLIEVAFPLEEVSAHSRREKNVRHGHISTLHIWWARRPLAACRAFIYASLVDDLETDAEREELLKEVADLASWDAVRHPDRVVRTKEDSGSGLTGAELLERARRRILDSNGGRAPKLLDPFAGGGAIPLEGLRLGCEVEASDLNPVAVLILKGTVEYPQKFGQPDSRPVPDYILRFPENSSQHSFVDGDLAESYRRNPLATDVRYWGNWMLEKAREELAEFYPPDPDGSVPIAYLWSRTIPCPNCGAEMPLIRQYWLARKSNKRVALEPVPDRNNNRVDFKVVRGSGVVGNPARATTSRGDSICLMCNQVVKAAQIRKLAQKGRMSATPTAVVLNANDKSGKRYREDTPQDSRIYAAAVDRLRFLESTHQGDIAFVPNEPVTKYPRSSSLHLYGMNEWSESFSARQLLALTVFARLVGETYERMIEEGLDDDYAKAVSTYLGLGVDRLANQQSTLSRWDVTGESLQGTFASQALPMVWDYCEGNPCSGATGDFASALRWIEGVIVHSSLADSDASPGTALVRRANASSPGHVSQPPAQIIVTGPSVL